MAVTIPNHYHTMFHSGLKHLVQQKGSKLRPHIPEESAAGEASFHDRIGATDAEETTTRFEDTPLIIVPHDRRMVTPRNATWATLLDSIDKAKVLTNPTNAYVQNARMSIGRKIDDFIIEAFFADAYSGRTGDTPVQFDSNNVVPVNDHSYDTGSGDIGMTVSKLQVIHDILKGNEVDPDEKLLLALAQKQVNDLLADPHLSSADYNTVRALQAGELNTFMKFNFIQIERLKLTPSTAHRRCMAWAQSGMLFAVLQELATRISERPDKNYAIQVWARIQANAVRMEEEKCVEVLCDE
jgi:hypothetical protein